MDFNVPNWLDQKFLTNVLKSEENKDVQVEVVNFNVEPAVAPGNNYLSYLYRVHIEYKTGTTRNSNKNVSLMVKVPLVDGVMKEVSEKYNFFDKEPKIYNQFLPILYKITCCHFGPKSLKCAIKDVVVMKDLKEEGYILCEKTKQLDFSHSAVVMKKLAKFHAATVVALHKNKELVREVGVDTFFVVENSSIQMMVKEALKNILNNIIGDERYVRFSGFVHERCDQIWPSLTKLTKPKLAGCFNVLNHGDLWINNILFKYNKSGDVVDVKFIDFQLSRISSPVNDLLYFIWTSTNDEVRGSRQKELFSIYLTTVNKTLATLGCEERLSEQELRDDINRSVDLVIFIASLCIPIMMASSQDAPDFANLANNEDLDTEKMHKIFKGKTFNKLIPTYIQQITEFFLESKGMYVWKK